MKFVPKNPWPKLFVPVCHNGGGGGKTGWAIALASSFNGRHVRFEEMGSSHADRQVNNMANQFLRTDCDVMLIIDIDTIFRESDIARVVAHLERGHQCVWGLYPKKQDDAPPCVNTWPAVPPADEHGLVNVRRSGRGFLAITRDVFEKLKEDNGGPALRFHNHEHIEWSFFRSGVVTGERMTLPPGTDKDGYPIREWITEDWFFCEDIRIHLGIPTLVDTGIVLKHVGEKTYCFQPHHVARVDSNISSWEDIHGWFDYEDLYHEIVQQIPDGGSFTEIGCWLGRSIAAFYWFAAAQAKSIHLYVVDTFCGEPANSEHLAILDLHGGNVRKAFDGNMKALGVGLAGVSEMNSTHAAIQFGDASQDAVFIDASHEYEDVKADIAAWLPKVKPGGILAGHDIDEAGVLRAVKESGLPFGIMGRCWLVKV